MRSPRLPVIVSTMIGLGAASALATTAPAFAGDVAPIVVAVEAPLSGAQASNGIDMLRGVKLAARELNAKGGINGRPVKIVGIDDKADPNLADDAVAKAKAAGAVAVIGPYNSSVGVINLPMYLDAGIVPVHMTSTNDTDGEGVTVQPKNDQIAPVEHEYIKALGAKTVNMLVDPSTYTQGMADRLSELLREDGMTVTQIPIAPGKADYADETSTALKGVPDVVYVSTYYPEGAKIAEALITSKLPTQTVFGLANVDPAFVTEAGLVAAQRPAFSGVPESAQMPGKAAAAYVRAFTKAFNAQPGVWGIFTYDSANLLFATMKAKGTDFSAVLTALKHTKNFKGATGSITIDPTTGNRVKVPVFMLRVDDRGVFEIIP